MRKLVLSLSVLLLSTISTTSSAIIYFCYEDLPKPTCSFTCEDGTYFSMHNQYGLDMCMSTATSSCGTHGGLAEIDYDPGVATLSCQEKTESGIETVIKKFHIKKKAKLKES